MRVGRLGLVSFLTLAVAQVAVGQGLVQSRSSLSPGDWDSVRAYAIDVTADGEDHVADELLVSLAPGADRLVFEEACLALGGKTIGVVSRLGLMRVQVRAGTDPLDERERFAMLPGVVAVDLNGLGKLGGVAPPDDTFFGEQWHLENTGQGVHACCAGADIEAVPAWGIETGDPTVLLAILDSGVDAGHPDLTGRLLQGFDFVEQDAVPDEDEPHGTYVTGLAAANADNSFGVAGIDHACTVLPIKVIDFGGTVMDLVQGIDYATAQGADVISMSLIDYPRGFALTNALQGARDAGAILVACAGNGGLGDADVSYPGASPLTISIGATDDRDIRASYSGTGAALDFVSPGDNVATIFPTQQNDGFSYFGGCSSATPVAAGIVTLLKARKPDLTHDQAYAALLAGAEDQVGQLAFDLPGRDDHYGHGRINAFASLASVSPCEDAVTYCFGKVNTDLCVPFMSASGCPSPTATDPFRVRADDVISGQAGLLVYGLSGRGNIPYHFAKLCLKAPLKRLFPPKSSGGGGGSCPGVLEVDFNNRIQSGNDPMLTPGQQVNAQWIYRDPGIDQFNDGLSDGIEFTIEQ